MKFKSFDLPVKQLENYPDYNVTTLQVQNDQSLICGFAFAEPLALRINVSGSTLKEDAFSDLKIRQVAGDDAVAVVNGFRYSMTGDTAASILHEGSCPQLLKSICGINLAKKLKKDYWDYIAFEAGGMGFEARHSLVQIMSGELSSRGMMESGVTLDVSFLADYLFGVTGGAIYREPYLRPDKRHVLRKDLMPVKNLHKSEYYFWVVGQNNMLMTMKLNDIKPKPTRLTLKDGDFRLSSYCATDDCLYGVDGKSGLFRVRINPETVEEELQYLHDFGEAEITGILVYEKEKNSALCVCTQENGVATLWTYPLAAFEDPELLPEPAELKNLGPFHGLEKVSNLTSSNEVENKAGIWAIGLEAKKPKLISFKI